VTFVLFVAITFFAGFIASASVDAVDERGRQVMSPFDEIFIADHVIVGEAVREAVGLFGLSNGESPWTPSAEEDRRFYSTGRSPRKPRKQKGSRRLQKWSEHFLKGFTFVGLLSFLQLLVGTFVLSPFTPLRNMLLRAIRPSRRRDRARGADLSTVMILIFILVGVMKAVTRLYKAVRWVSKKALGRMEGMVLEVGSG